jgi:hypothetical protein
MLESASDGPGQKRCATGRAVLRRLAHVVPFRYHRQGRTITAAMPRTAGLLPPLAGTGHPGCTSTVGTRSLLALHAVQALWQIADRGLMRFHLRLQGRCSLQKSLVLPPSVVRLPLELNIGLLRQYHRLLGKRRGTTPVHRCKFGGRNHLWYGAFHGLLYSSFGWKVPLFLKGEVG